MRGRASRAPSAAIFVAALARDRQSSAVRLASDLSRRPRRPSLRVPGAGAGAAGAKRASSSCCARCRSVAMAASSMVVTCCSMGICRRAGSEATRAVGVVARAPTRSPTVCSLGGAPPEDRARTSRANCSTPGEASSTPASRNARFATSTSRSGFALLVGIRGAVLAGARAGCAVLLRPALTMAYQPVVRVGRPSKSGNSVAASSFAAWRSAPRAVVT